MEKVPFMQTSDKILICCRPVFVVVIGTITVVGGWIIDRYYDAVLWWAWLKLKH